MSRKILVNVRVNNDVFTDNGEKLFNKGEVVEAELTIASDGSIEAIHAVSTLRPNLKVALPREAVGVSF